MYYSTLMKIKFYKYQGTGNDFVMIDNRLGDFPSNDKELISYLCDRKFGVGADGLILLEKDTKSDFKMIYYNSDGNESTMCGNGGRCIVSFAHYLGIIENETKFIAVDGLHLASIQGTIVHLKMQDVQEIKSKPGALFLNTGSPHHVQLVSDLSKLNVVKEGAKLRYGLYGKEGSNINFVEENEVGGFFVRTYERGVEDETLSCGTGVTAVALAMHAIVKTKNLNVKIQVLGGELEVTFVPKNKGYKQVYLIGEAKQVFKGELQWNS